MGYVVLLQVGILFSRFFSEFDNLIACGQTAVPRLRESPQQPAPPVDRRGDHPGHLYYTLCTYLGRLAYLPMHYASLCYACGTLKVQEMLCSKARQRDSDGKSNKRVFKRKSAGDSGFGFQEVSVKPLYFTD